MLYNKPTTNRTDRVSAKVWLKQSWLDEISYDLATDDQRLTIQATSEITFIYGLEVTAHRELDFALYRPKLHLLSHLR